MAKFYMGNPETCDKGMWDALRALPDDYHVFIEFQIPDPQRQRQVDFLVIRESADTGCLFLLEVKNERRRLRGTINGPWQYEEVPGAWMPLFTSNRQDQNPLQQAYNTAMVMKNWLLSMQALIQDPEDPWPDPYQTLTIFPRLVLPFAHRDNQLQIDRFTWRFDSDDETVESLMRFVPREPFPLSRTEMQRLAQHLGVRPLSDSPAVATDSDLAAALRTQFSELTAQLAALRQEIQALRVAFTRNGGTPGPQRAAAAHGAPIRSLDEVFEALVEVIKELRDHNRRRAFPNVHEGLVRRLGSFSPAAFGFQRFRDFMAEAERRGYITAHTVGALEYASLPGENVASLAAGAAGEAASGLATSLLTLNRGDQIQVKVLNLPLHTKWMDPWAELTGVVRGDTRVPFNQPGLEVQVVSTKEQRTLSLTSKMVHLIPSFDVPPEFREERFVLDEAQPWKQLKGDAVERIFLPKYVGTEVDAEIVSITPTGNIVANCRALDQALIQAYEEAKAAERGEARSEVPTTLLLRSDGPPRRATNGTDPVPSAIALAMTIGELADQYPDALAALLRREEFAQLADEAFLNRLRPFSLERVCALVSARPDEVLAAVGTALSWEASGSLQGTASS
ncbi:MAG: NERD domain-containing protein [Chloroflexi bacterium]|nr:NERD domain-containing protein [Chloroflexota bacterium]